jgi:hypothetical protein
MLIHKGTGAIQGAGGGSAAAGVRNGFPKRGSAGMGKACFSSAPVRSMKNSYGKQSLFPGPDYGMISWNTCNGNGGCPKSL